MATKVAFRGKICCEVLLKMNQTEILTILMANYNNGKYIAEAIDSVINQTSHDWKMIIVDDKSTDNSIEVINHYQDSRIVLVQNEVNLGYIGTLKKLIDLSNTDIVGILDPDDALVQNAVAAVISSYEKHPNCGFVYSQFIVCDENLTPLFYGSNRQCEPGKTNLINNCVSHFKTFRKSVYRQTEGYDAAILYAEDKDLILKMEEKTKLYFNPEPLYKYRLLPSGQGNDMLKREIGKLSYHLAKYNAYMRRSKTGYLNISKDELLYDLHQQFSLRNRLSEKLYNFKVNAYKRIRMLRIVKR